MSEVESEIAWSVINCFRSGGKLLIAGNGGSAADAQHIAAEFLGRFKIERPPLPAIALASDAATLTAIGNDYGFANVFLRPLSALAKPGDVFLAISTSGKSENVLAALVWAKCNGIHSIGFTGLRGDLMGEHCDRLLVIESDDAAMIQQGYMAAAHRICGEVERVMFT